MDPVAADEIKKCSVRIGGVSYQLVTNENETYTRQIAARADEMIKRVMQDNPQLSQAMATVLALVNAVDELSRAYQQLKGQEGSRLDLDRKASEAKNELNRMREQNWDMKKELLRLQELNREYQALISKLTTPEVAEESDPEPEAPLLAEETPQEKQDPPDENDKRTMERLQQTNLDDYLQAYGLTDLADKPGT